MKKNRILAIALVAASLVSVMAQAPLDLSYLTSQPALASYLFTKGSEIELSLYLSSAGVPQVYDCPQGYVCVPVEQPTEVYHIPYSGPPSLAGIAQALEGFTFKPQAMIPDSFASVTVWVKGLELPKSNSKQFLLGGSAGGKPVYDGTNWKLPPKNSKTGIFLNSEVFVPIPNLKNAWVVETNSSGWAIKRSLQPNVWIDQGLWFDTSLAGEAHLCLIVGDGIEGGKTSTWVYDIHEGSDARRSPPSPVLIQVLLDSSETVRDFTLESGDNPTSLFSWIYTYQPENKGLVYGRVPLLMANYTKLTTAYLSVGSDVGYATGFKITRISDGYGPQTVETIWLPKGAYYIPYLFSQGLYHIEPLGIDVHTSWWKIQDVEGGGAIGKGSVEVIAPSEETTPVTPPTTSSDGNGP